MNLRILTTSLWCFLFTYNCVSQEYFNPYKIRGVCWVAGDSVVSGNFDNLVDNHVEWISQTPFGWQNGIDNPVIGFDNHNSLWGERDEGLIHTAKLAHSKGIKVMLKPHIWVKNANGKWRSDIHMNSKTDWESWFDHYQAMIMHYARIAEQGNMESLCIGTELLHPATKFPEKWRKIIQDIRSVYTGKLTYAANFYQELEGITFWDALDAIGVQGYFPLVKEKNPSESSLVEAWKPHIRLLESIHQKYGKPVIFTEIGYRNSEDAGIEPWIWPRQLDENVLPSDQTQENCFHALFRSVWRKNWFHGLFVWKWFHPGYKHNSYAEWLEYRIKRRNAYRKNHNIKARQYITFSPQGRPAEKVIQNHFKVQRDLAQTLDK